MTPCLAQCRRTCDLVIRTRSHVPGRAPQSDTTWARCACTEAELFMIKKIHETSLLSSESDCTLLWFIHSVQQFAWHCAQWGYVEAGTRGTTPLRITHQGILHSNLLWGGRAGRRLACCTWVRRGCRSGVWRGRQGRPCMASAHANPSPKCRSHTEFCTNSQSLRTSRSTGSRLGPNSDGTRRLCSCPVSGTRE